MNDHEILSDAFSELERRADVATAHLPADPLHAARASHRPRLLLVAAAAVVAAGVAVGGTWLAGRGTTHPGHGTTAPHQSAAGPVFSSPTAPPAFQIPQTPEELAARFKIVLGDTATFTVTDTGHPMNISLPPSAPTNGASEVPVTGDPNGAAIVGTLTADGVTGGFDIQIYRASSGEKAMCDDPDRSRCSVITLADGSTIAVGHEPLQGSANGVTYEVDYVRNDGAVFLMHLSNERDPKGESTVLAPQPPLTRAQMKSIVMSDNW